MLVMSSSSSGLTKGLHANLGIFCSEISVRQHMNGVHRTKPRHCIHTTQADSTFPARTSRAIVRSAHLKTVLDAR